MVPGLFCLWGLLRLGTAYVTGSVGGRILAAGATGTLMDAGLGESGLRRAWKVSKTGHCLEWKQSEKMILYSDCGVPQD